MPYPAKSAWPMPVPLYAWDGGREFAFESMMLYVVVRETVATVTVASMARLRDLNAACEARLRRIPFLLLRSGPDRPLQAVSVEDGPRAAPFDPNAHPVVEARAETEGDIVFLNWQSPVTTYRWRDGAYALDGEALVLSGTMCMPRALRPQDIGFFVDERRAHLRKQLDDGLMVLDDGLVASLYETRRLTHRKTIPYAS